MSSNREKIRKKIMDIYNENKNFSYSQVARCAKVSRQTARNVILKFKRDLCIKHNKGGGPNGFRNPKIVQKVIAAWKQKPSLSLRDMARKFGISKSLVERIKKKHNLKTFKVKIVPNRDEKGTKTARIRARKLLFHKLNNFKGCIIMDDETYCKSDYLQLPGQRFYIADKRGNVADKFKYKKLSKFAKKYMVWQAICTCGMVSKAVIVKRTMNSELYVNECLQKAVLPMYRKHNIAPLFWPDLASCHYSKNVLDWYAKNNINFVPKAMNPPNCPELRPIERYWAIVKQNLRRRFRPPKSVKTFGIQWKKTVQKIGRSGVQKLMRHVKKKVRNFAKKNCIF